MTTAAVRLSESHVSTIIDHCIDEAPNEGCGLLAFDDDTVVRVYPTANDSASPTLYTIPPQAHFNALLDAELNGWRLGGVFHSHPGGRPEPSPIDVAGALDPEWVHVIVSLGGGAKMRAWQIIDSAVSELELEIR